MEAERFDTLTRSLVAVGTRRSILALLSTLGLTTLLTRPVSAQECLSNESRCGRADDPVCCSGWCKRKKGSRKKFCRQAPDQGACLIVDDACREDPTPCNTEGSPNCVCYVTRRGFSFCGTSIGACFNCQSDADCEKRNSGGQEGDRCVVCRPNCPTTNNRLCVRKCPDPISM